MGRRKHGRVSGQSLPVANEAFSADEEIDSEQEISLDDAQRLTSLSQLRAGETLLGKRKAQKNKDFEETSEKKLRKSVEESYERVPRKSSWKDEEEIEYFLPTKSKEGFVYQIKQNKEIQETSLSDSEAVGSPDIVGSPDAVEESEGIVEENEDLSTLSTVELFARREKKVSEKKELIGTTALKLIEDPENNIGLLKTLCSLCVEGDPEVCVTVRKLALVSTMAVFKDIVPGYHIRALAEEDKKVKISREVRRLRDFEQTLLRKYQQYLIVLGNTVAAGTKSNKVQPQKSRSKHLSTESTLPETSLKSLTVVAVRCLCELMTSLAHFNFRTNIFTVVVPLMRSGVMGGKLSLLCCDAVKTVFERDVVGEVSLELIELITKMIKAKKYRTRPQVLETFLHLRLHDVIREQEKDASQKNKKKIQRVKMSKKEKKRQKKLVLIQKEMRETEAVESNERKNKLQTEILKQIFSTYFRILKYDRTSGLISSVLEGLAKFSHLINVDFFADLLLVLENCISSKSLNQRQCFHCVLTAFQILSGQGESLSIDPRNFYNHFYTQILHLDMSLEDKDVILPVDCLKIMFQKRRQVSLQRVLSFIKRLATVSLQVVPACSLALLSIIRQFLISYPRVDRLLDNESALLGQFNPEVADPELSGADSAVLWELPLLTRHCDPLVSTYAVHLSLGAPSHGKGALHSSSSPSELVTTHSLLDNDPFKELPSELRLKGKEARRKKHSCSELMKKAEVGWHKMADTAERELESLKHSIL